MGIHQYGFSDHPVTHRPCVVALGSFDGVHRGHQYLLSEAKKIAVQHNFLFAAVTFRQLPRCVLQHDDPPRRIITAAHRQKLLTQLGVDILIELPFTDDIRTLSAVDFLDQICQMVPVRVWVGGVDLSFGYQRGGDKDFLINYFAAKNVTCLVLDKLQVERISFSSTRIRQAIQEADFSTLKSLLGRPYSIYAEVKEKRENSFTLDARELCFLPFDVLEAKALTPDDEFDVQLTLDQEAQTYTVTPVKPELPELPPCIEIVLLKVPTPSIIYTQELREE